jgi:hypothetical protein
MAASRRNRPPKNDDPNAIHYPHRNGPVCGVVPAPTDAKSYAIERAEVDCEMCIDYLDRMEAWGKRVAAQNAAAGK